jgi:hypothetical protein
MSDVEAAYQLNDGMVKLTWIARQNETVMRDNYLKFCVGEDIPSGKYFFEDLSEQGVTSYFGVAVRYAMLTRTSQNGMAYKTISLFTDEMKIAERVVYEYRRSTSTWELDEMVAVNADGAQFTKQRHSMARLTYIAADGILRATWEQASGNDLRVYWRAAAADWRRLVLVPTWANQIWFSYSQYTDVAREQDAIAYYAKPGRPPLGTGVVKRAGVERQLLLDHLFNENDTWIQNILGGYFLAWNP